MYPTSPAEFGHSVRHVLKARRPSLMANFCEHPMPLLTQQKPKSIWLRYGLPITVFCITYASFHTRVVTTPHTAVTLIENAFPDQLQQFKSSYALLERLTYHSQPFSVACNNIDYVLCSSAVCKVVPGTNLTWCECEVKHGTAQLSPIIDNAYLLWSPVYRRILDALAAGAFDFANDIFCKSIRTDPFWIDTVSAKLANTTPLLSLSGEAEIGDTAINFDDSRTGCRLNITQCMGAPCYTHGPNATTASCVCPFKYIDVPAAVISTMVSPQSIQKTCNEPTVCAVHSRIWTNNGHIPSDFATLDMTTEIRNQMLNLDYKSNPFHSEVCEWSS